VILPLIDCAPAEAAAVKRVAAKKTTARENVRD